MKMFDLKELSQEINISIRTLSRYIRQRRPDVTLVGRSNYVTETELMYFLKDEKARS